MYGPPEPKKIDPIPGHSLIDYLDMFGSAGIGLGAVAAGYGTTGIVLQGLWQGALRSRKAYRENLNEGNEDWFDYWTVPGGYTKAKTYDKWLQWHNSWLPKPGDYTQQPVVEYEPRNQHVQHQPAIDTQNLLKGHDNPIGMMDGLGDYHKRKRKRDKYQHWGLGAQTHGFQSRGRGGGIPTGQAFGATQTTNQAPTEITGGAPQTTNVPPSNALPPEYTNDPSYESIVPTRGGTMNGIPLQPPPQWQTQLPPNPYNGNHNDLPDDEPDPGSLDKPAPWQPLPNPQLPDPSFITPVTKPTPTPYVPPTNPHGSVQDQINRQAGQGWLNDFENWVKDEWTDWNNSSGYQGNKH
jgi:hypothetical protein